MSYTLGLDIGITSVGWAVLDWEKERVLDLGVRLFPGAENPKDGSSLAAPRRDARGARRRTRRKAQRMRDVRRLIVERAILTQQEMDSLFAKAYLTTPWELRVAGLDRKLSPAEFSRVLVHIAKHRGFRSNRTVSPEDKSAGAQEEGKANAAIRANQALLEQSGYRTVGEMLCNDGKFAEHKRNKAGDYQSTVARSELKKEIQVIFERQRSLGNEFAGSELEKEFLDIFSRQLPFASGDMIEKLTGACTLEPSCKRAPKSSWTAERFILLSKIANLSIRSEGTKYVLAPDDMRIIEQMAYKQSKVTYKQIRAAFETAKTWVFAELPSKMNDSDKDPEEKTFVELKAFHSFRKAITNSLGKAYWENLVTTAPQIMDTLALGLTFRKTDEDIMEYLSERGIDSKLIEAVLPLNFSGVVNLSLEAMGRLIPHMECGLRYDEACVQAGYHHSNPKDSEDRSPLLPLPDPEEVRNPVVLRALTQTRKVVNAIIRKYGSPEEIHIELARELAKSKEDRNKIKKTHDENFNEKKRLSEDYDRTYGRKPNSSDLLKFRLWKEQGGFCPYSGKYIDPMLAFMSEDGTYAEIDHVLPYSRSLNDSYINKVLVIGSENRNKRNMTPYEYFGKDGQKWDEFIARVDSTFKGKGNKKAELLKKRDFDEEESTQMKDRSLGDTRYITRYAANWMEKSLVFSDPARKRPVIRLNGQATSILRIRWGINALKNREESDLHHALDACVVAAATPAMIKRISDASREREQGMIKAENPADKRNRLPEPWHRFRKEVEARLSPDPAERIREFGLTNYSEEDLNSLKPVFISRKPDRKATGAAHQETIRSAKYLSEGMTAVKTPLTSVKKEDLEKMVGKDRDSDLYEDLKARLEAFDNKPDKAFKEEFRRRTKDGKPGPVVRSIKLLTPGTSGVLVRNGIASNGSMVRVDVYSKNSKFFLIPYYVDDIARGVVKNRAITAHKEESQWRSIDSSYEFCFSLFYNDLVFLDDGKGKQYLAYYQGTHRGTGAVNLLSHDGAIRSDGVGIQRARVFEKYQVDVLGNYYKVKREKPPHELA